MMNPMLILVRDIHFAECHAILLICKSSVRITFFTNSIPECLASELMICILLWIHAKIQFLHFDITLANFDVPFSGTCPRTKPTKLCNMES